MSELTQILNGIAQYNWEQSKLPKKALPLFRKKYKDLYYQANDEAKRVMREGFNKTKETK